MRRVSIDFDNLSDYEYESGGAGFIGSLELLSSFQGRVDELLWLNGKSRWNSDFELPKSPHTGNSDHLVISDSLDRFDLVGDFCFCCFSTIRSPFGSSDSRSIFSLESSDGESLRFQIGTDNSFLGTRLSLTTNVKYVKRTTISEPIEITIGPWYHLACTRKGDRTYLFFNGKKIGEGIFGNKLSNVSIVRIGASYEKNSLIDFFHGQMDEILFDNLNYRWDDDFLIPIEPFSISYSFIHKIPQITLDPYYRINADLTKGLLEKTSTPVSKPPPSDILEINIAKVGSSDKYSDFILSEQPNHYFQFNDLTSDPLDCVGGLMMNISGNVHQRQRSITNSSSTLFEMGGYGRVSNWQWKPSDSWSIEFWSCYQNQNNKAQNESHKIDFSSDNFPPILNHIFLQSNGYLFIFGIQFPNPSNFNHFDGKWHYVCISLNHLTNTLYAQIDDITSSVSVLSTFRLSFNKGYMFFGGTGKLYSLYNDLAFYDKHLTPEQMLNHYSRGLEKEVTDIWLLDSEGSVVEKYDDNSIVCSPPKIIRNLDNHSLLSVSSIGKSWTKIEGNQVTLYERISSDPLVLENNISLDYYSNDFMLEGLSTRVPKLPKLSIEIEKFLQEGNDIDIPAVILDDDMSTRANIVLKNQPSIDNILLPIHYELETDKKINILIFDKLWGNNFLINLSRTELNKITLNQTNALSLIYESKWFRRDIIKYDNLNGNLEKTSVGDLTRFTGLGSLEDLSYYDIYDKSFEMFFDVELTNKNLTDITNFTLYLYGKSTDTNHLYVQFFSDSNVINLRFRINGTNYVTNVSTFSKKQKLRIKVIYTPGTLKIEHYSLSKPDELATVTVVANLIFTKLNFSLISASNTSDFMLTPIVLSNLTKEQLEAKHDVSKIQNNDKIFEIDYSNPYSVTKLDQVVVEKIPPFKKVNVQLKKGVSNIPDLSLIHVFLFNQIDYIRNFSAAKNGIASCMIELIETGSNNNLAFLNFDNSRTFLCSLDDTETYDINCDPSIDSISSTHLISLDYGNSTNVNKYEEIDKVILGKLPIRAMLGDFPIKSVGEFQYKYSISSSFDDDDEEYGLSNLVIMSESSDHMLRRYDSNKMVSLVPAPLLKDPKAPILYFPFKNNNLKNQSSRFEFKYKDAKIEDNDFDSVPNSFNEPDSAIRISHSNIIIPTISFANTSDFSVCFWIRDHVLTSNTNYRYPITIIHEQYPFYFRFKPIGIWDSNIKRNGYAGYVPSGYANVGTTNDFCDKWSHLAITKNSTTILIYRNGIKCDSTTGTPYFPEEFPFQGSVIIGDKTGSANDFSIHDFFLFDKCLDVTEVERTMNNPEYYHVKNDEDLYSGMGSFMSTDSSFDIIMDPVVTASEKPLLPNSLIQLDYSQGSLSDLKRSTNNITCSFKALGTFETSKKSTYDASIRIDTSRQIRLYYDYLGIINKTPQLTAMRLGSL